MSYIETPADHAFTAFLADLSPRKVLRDRSATFSRVERGRQKFLAQKQHVEGLRVAEASRLGPVVSVERQLEIAMAVLEKNERAGKA